MNILITHPIDQEAIRELRKRHDVDCAVGCRPDELPARLRNREILIFRSSLRVTATLVEGAPRLRMLIRAGLGCDNVDLACLRRRRVKLLHVPMPRASAVLRAVEEFYGDDTPVPESVGLHAGLDFYAGAGAAGGAGRVVSLPSSVDTEVHAGGAKVAAPRVAQEEVVRLHHSESDEPGRVASEGSRHGTLRQ